MQIGTFRRQVGKVMVPKPTKKALQRVSKNTVRTQIAQAAVGLNVSTGRLVQVTTPYLLGLPQTEEIKQSAAEALGDIGFHLVALTRVLKVKVPSSTKKIKLVGTRGAAILHLDGVASEILRVAEQGLFVPPKTNTEKKMVTMPQKGGVKEERDVEVVDVEAEQTAETARQEQMKSALSGAVDVFWRLCFDVTGKSPEAVLDAKFTRMQQEYPGAAFDPDKKQVKKNGGISKGKGKKAAAVATEAVPA